MEKKHYVITLTEEEMIEVYSQMSKTASDKESAVNYLLYSPDETNPNQIDINIAKWLRQLAEKFKVPSYDYREFYSSKKLYLKSLEK